MGIKDYFWQLLMQYRVSDLRSPVFWLQPNDNTNNLAFDLRGAGLYSGDLISFVNLYGYTAYWSSDASSSGSTTGTGLMIQYYCSQIEIVQIKKTDAVSVRCIMD